MQHHPSTDRYFLFLLILMSLLLFWPLYSGHSSLKWDAADLTLPVFSLIRTALWQGEWPLWNSFQDQGWATGIVPLFWNPIYLVLGGLFAAPHKALNTLYLILTLVSGWGFYKFSGLFFRHRTSAVIAGLIYPLTGFFIAHSQHLGWIEGAAWSPVILYLSHRYYQGKRIHHLLFLGITFYLFSTAAYPGFVVMMIYLLFLQAMHHLFHSENGRRASTRLIFHVGIATGLLSWLTWKLYYEQLIYITRGTGDWAISTSTGSSAFSNLWSLVFSKTSTTALDTFWGTDPAFVNSFFGLILLAFAGYAVLRKADRIDIKLVLAAFFFLMISMADALPFREWLNFLPGFSYFRTATLFQIFFIAPMIILGIKGLEKCFYLQEKRKMGFILAGTGLSIFLLRFIFLSGAEISNTEVALWNQYLTIDTWKAVFFLGTAALVLILRTPFSFALLGILAIGDVGVANFLNQDSLLYNPAPTAEFSADISHPERKPFHLNPGQPIGKYEDKDFQTTTIYRNTGSLFHQLVKDGYWPFQSHSHHALKRSGKFEQQARFPLIYLSSDTSDFVTPDHLNFEDHLSIRSQTMNRYEIDLLIQKSMALILNQNYHKNWQARINGKIIPVCRTNESMIKMEVPAGMHSLTLEYTSGGTNHLFWVTMLLFVSGGLVLIKRGNLPLHFLLPGFPLLFLALSPSPEQTDSPSPGKLPVTTTDTDFKMNYESKQDFWYFRPAQITIADSYDGYRAESLNEKHVYSATLNIPRGALAGKTAIQYRFHVKSETSAEPAVVLYSHTTEEDLYNIQYHKSFHSGKWEILEGRLDLPVTDAPFIKADFYIWNHKKDNFLIDDIQIKLIP